MASTSTRSFNFLARRQGILGNLSSSTRATRTLTAPTTAKVVAPTTLKVFNKSLHSTLIHREQRKDAPGEIGQGKGVKLEGAVDIDPSLLTINKTTSPTQIPPSSSLIWGKTFCDHMLSIPWSLQSGWGAPKIHAYEPLSLDPSATVLHYGYTLFEGMKAYKDEEGKVRLFRPDKNMERMNRSAARLALPNFTDEKLIELIKKLVVLDKDWIPSDPGTSLYIRPTLIGTQNSLGVAAPDQALLYVICSPVGPYYKSGFKPVSLLASNKYTRAWPGGTGSFKLGANYAPTTYPALEAAKDGYQQILWLYGEEEKLTEVGVMNLFMVIENDQGKTEIITPPLDDMILPGVTRDSVVSLARSHADGSLKIDGLPEQKGDWVVTEGDVNMSQLLKWHQEGRVKEMFGTGTAAIVSSIKEVGYRGKNFPIPVGEEGLGPIAKIMHREIVGRQLGNIKSDWSVPCN